MATFLVHPFSERNFSAIFFEIDMFVLLHELKTFTSQNKGLYPKFSGGGGAH